MAEEFTIVQLVLMDETGDSFYRMRWPARDLAQQQPSWRVVNLDARSPKRYKLAAEADLLVVYQSNDIDLLPIIKRRKAQGKRTLVEYNDNFYAPPASSPVAEQWSSPLVWQVYEAFMREADGVIVTGPGLKDLFKSKTDRDIFIIQNHLPLRPKSKIKEFDSVNIGWAGSLGHAADLLAIAPTIKKLLEIESRVTFYLMGNVTLPEIIDIPKERIKFVPWGGMNEYYAFLDNLHIGLAPLLDTPYNRCRSDIKAVEIAASSSLAVLTEILPYHDFISKTETPSFKSLQELSDLLFRLVKNPHLIQSSINRSFDYVSKERVGIDRKERCEIYTEFAPKAKSIFTWGFKVGYHEVIDSPDLDAPASVCIKNIEREIKSKELAKAKKILDQGIIDNEFSIDLVLIKATRFFESERASFELLEKIEQVYPYDLRITICKALLTRDPKMRIKAWRLVIENYANNNSTYQDYFSSELVRRFSPELLRGIEYREQYKEIAHEILSLIPHAVTLRLALIELFRKEGDINATLSHIEYVLDFWKRAQFNQKLLKELPESYLMSLQEALHARTRDKLVS